MDCCLVKVRNLREFETKQHTCKVNKPVSHKAEHTLVGDKSWETRLMSHTKELFVYKFYLPRRDT